jgi:uncharacterized membrane protein
MTRSSLTLSRFLTAIVVAASVQWISASPADEVSGSLPKPSAEKNLTFAEHIKPLFERSCTKCHGEEKQKAKLRLDSRQNALNGAGDEKVILPGRSAASELVLVAAKATKDEDEWMPPPGKAQPLSVEEIGLLRAWIDQGAK